MREPDVGPSVTDPDGYNIDFESPTDVPEETECAETDGLMPQCGNSVTADTF